MYTLRIQRQFSAAHSIPGHPKCQALHGHTWKVEIALRGDTLNGLGFLVDFGEVKVWLDEVLPDHQHLNDTFDFSPTAENLSRWLYYQAVERFSNIVKEVVVWESEGASSSYAEW